MGLGSTWPKVSYDERVIIDQPRRQGRQGRPAVLVHRARRHRRRQRQRRPRLRQGQGGARRHPEGHGGGKKNLFAVPLAGSRITHSMHRRARRGARAAEAGGARYRRHRRWRGPGDPRRGRHPRRARQVARLVERHQRGPRHHRRACRSLQRPDEVARSCAACRPRSSCPRACSTAYQRDASAARSWSTEVGDDEPALKVTQVRSAHRHQAEAPRHAARARPARHRHRRNTLPDRPEIRGMIARVPHLVTVEGGGELT